MNEAEKCNKKSQESLFSSSRTMYLLVPLGLQTMLEEMAQITLKANWILLMRFTAPTNSQTTD
jgi:hypothetical protein